MSARDGRMATNGPTPTNAVTFDLAVSLTASTVLPWRYVSSNGRSVLFVRIGLGNTIADQF